MPANREEYTEPNDVEEGSRVPQARTQFSHIKNVPQKLSKESNSFHPFTLLTSWQYKFSWITKENIQAIKLFHKTYELIPRSYSYVVLIKLEEGISGH